MTYFRKKRNKLRQKKDITSPIFGKLRYEDLTESAKLHGMPDFDPEKGGLPEELEFERKVKERGPKTKRQFDPLDKDEIKEEVVAPAEEEKPKHKSKFPMIRFNLLTDQSVNPKTAKALKYSSEWASPILHLAPSDLAGCGTTCPVDQECKEACLNTSLHGGMLKPEDDSNMVNEARIRKTRLLYENPDAFWDLLKKDILKLLSHSEKYKRKPAMRPNGTSDLAWEDFRPEELNGNNIFEAYPEVQFYDYTKRPGRVIRNKHDNYHLVFSRTAKNHKIALKLLKMGYNVAVVFGGKKIPQKWEGFNVIDGDEHDLRFLDPKSDHGEGVVIGLTAKGEAMADTSGFVVWGHDGDPEAKPNLNRAKNRFRRLMRRYGGDKKKRTRGDTYESKVKAKNVVKDEPEPSTEQPEKEQQKRKAKVKRKKPLETHGHHTIPVAENIDWHLRNLWGDEGNPASWTTIKDVPVKEHIDIHRKDLARRMKEKKQVKKSEMDITSPPKKKFTGRKGPRSLSMYFRRLLPRVGKAEMEKGDVVKLDQARDEKARKQIEETGTTAPPPKKTTSSDIVEAAKRKQGKNVVKFPGKQKLEKDVVSLDEARKKKQQKDKEKEAEGDEFAQIMARNKANLERMKRDRQSSNESVKRSYRLKRSLDALKQVWPKLSKSAQEQIGAILQKLTKEELEKIVLADRPAKAKDARPGETTGEYHQRTGRIPGDKPWKKGKKKDKKVKKKAPEGVDPDKHESCVRQVKEQGHDVGSAHAICTDSMKKDEQPTADPMVGMEEKHPGIIPEDHPDREKVAQFITQLNKKPGSRGRAFQLYSRFISGDKYTKSELLSDLIKAEVLEKAKNPPSRYDELAQGPEKEFRTQRDLQSKAHIDIEGYGKRRSLSTRYSDYPSAKDQVAAIRSAFPNFRGRSHPEASARENRFKYGGRHQAYMSELKSRLRNKFGIPEKENATLDIGADSSRMATQKEKAGKLKG